MKPPEVLTRDRLLASYQVRPVLDKLRQTLLGAGVILLTSSVLLVGLIQSGTDEYGVYGECRAVMYVCATAVTHPTAWRALAPQGHLTAALLPASYCSVMLELLYAVCCLQCGMPASLCLAR